MPPAPAAPHAAPGYVTDVTYPDYFHRELMPRWIVSTLQALGRRAPSLDQPFTWLELGCGSGISALVAAATHPHSQCIGVDINPQAIAQAQALAQAAGIGNVQFLCADFAQLAQHAQTPWPMCDFIVSHGVYSWVSAPHRQHLRDLVQRSLQPGGVCYLAYMSQPGSASLSALQKLAHLHAQRMPGDSTAQAQSTLALLQRTANAGTGYFAEHARLHTDLEQLAQMDLRYVAHEFLNAHWDCLHVADVMADMQAAGCEWAGSATTLENIDAASVPQSALPLLHNLLAQGATAPELETFKDIARNQNQRRDLYQRSHPQGNTLTQEAHRQQLLQQHITLMPTAPAPGVQPGAALRLDTRIGPVDMPMAHIQPLLQTLQQGPCSYADLLQHPLYARQPALVSQLLQTLVWAGWLHFVDARAASAAATPSDTVQRLNQALAQRPCGPAGQIYWAAPRAGTALVIPPGEDAPWLQQRLRWLSGSAA